MTTTNQIANPTILGLLGFGMTTVLFSLCNLDILEKDSVVMTMALLYGGVAQAIAGLMEYKRGKAFSSTAFTSFGMLWIIIVAISGGFFGFAPAEPESMAVLFGMWGVIAYVFFIGTLKTGPLTFQIAFFGVATLFIILAIADGTGSDILLKIGGALGIFCGALALYIASGELLNEVYEKPVVKL